MNPFDLRGPEFLVLYIGLSVVVIIAAVVLRQYAESADAPRIDLSDPLLIAYLRGGDKEVMRVAVVSLIDRGLLECSGTRLHTAKHARPESVRREIDKALLKKFASSAEVSSMFDDFKLRSICYEYEETLKRVRLLPDNSITLVRTVIFSCVILVLGGVGLIKLMVAFSRGRTNVGFLIVLIIVSIVVAAKLSFPRLTQSGKAMLEDLKNLYFGLKDRASLLRPGGATLEPMMLAAVFGVGALAGMGFAFTKVFVSTCSKVHQLQVAAHAGVLAAVRVEVPAAVVAAGEDVVAVEAKHNNDLFGLGWRPQLAFGILSNLDRIDVVEVIADDFFDARRSERRALKTLAAQVPVTLHGVSMGLASSVEVERRRLERSARLCEEIRPLSWSEHLAFVRGGGIEIGHLAAPPRCDETIEGTLRNLSLARAIVGVVPQLENVATLIDPPLSRYDEASWISEIICNSQSDLLLDLHNLHANASNFGFDPIEFISRIPSGRIRAIHLAGGRWVGTGNVRRVLDDHLHDVPDPVYALLEEVGARTDPGLTVILERDGHFPPIESLLDQLDQARQAIARGRSRTREVAA